MEDVVQSIQQDTEGKSRQDESMEDTVREWAHQHQWHKHSAGNDEHTDNARNDRLKRHSIKNLKN